MTKASDKDSIAPLVLNGKTISHNKTITVNSEGWPVVTYSFDVNEEGLYYLSIMAMPADDASFTVRFNGGEECRSVNSEGLGWQIMRFDNGRTGQQPVYLSSGTNTISFISSAYEVPQVRDIVISQNENECSLSLDNYHRLIDDINAGGSSIAQSASSLYPTNYQYDISCPIMYSTTLDMVITNNSSFTIRRVAGFNDPIIVDVFKDAVFTKSYILSSTSSMVSATMPNGNYTVHLRRSGQQGSQTGVISLTHNGHTTTYSNCVASGYNISTQSRSIYSTGNVNYFTCNTTAGCNPTMYLCSGNSTPYDVKYINDNYSGSGIYSWGNDSRCSLPHNTSINELHLFSTNPNTPDGVCDVYQRLPSALANRWNAVFLGTYPRLYYDDAIVTDEASTNYNCISWTGDIMEYWEWPLDITSSHYIEGNPLGSFDHFYMMRGYTRTGASSSNAGVALWAKDDVFTHASIRNNSMSNYPHGYDWESKMGANERIMHPKEALMSVNYGVIAYYYKPNNSSNSLSTRGVLEPLVSLDYDSSIISSYIRNYIREDVAEIYSNLYTKWKERCQERDIQIHSNPYFYKQNAEYNQLLEYCIAIGKNALPLVYEKLFDKDLLSMFLLVDLMNDEDKAYMAEIKNTVADPRRECAPIYNAMCYAAGSFERDFVK